MIGENAHRVCRVCTAVRLTRRAMCSRGHCQCASFSCSRGRAVGQEVNEDSQRSGEHSRSPAVCHPKCVNDQPHPHFSFHGLLEVFPTVLGPCLAALACGSLSSGQIPGLGRSTSVFFCKLSSRRAANSSFGCNATTLARTFAAASRASSTR